MKSNVYIKNLTSEIFSKEGLSRVFSIPMWTRLEFKLQIAKTSVFVETQAQDKV